MSQIECQQSEIVYKCGRGDKQIHVGYQLATAAQECSLVSEAFGDCSVEVDNCKRTYKLPGVQKCNLRIRGCKGTLIHFRDCYPARDNAASA